MEIFMINNISFPSLGLNMTINRTAFTVFGKDIYWYALIIVLGFLLGLIFVMSTAKKYNVDTDYLYDIAIGGLIFGILGARIYYVIFDPSVMQENPLNFFKIWEGGIAIYGGLIGAALFAFFYCRYKKLNTLKIFDVCAPGLLIGQCIGRWGNFVNAEVYGKETSFFLGMSINGSAPVHPLFLYESLWNLLGLLFLIYLRRRKTYDGQIFFTYLLWYSFGRLWLEGMRQSQYILWLIPPDSSYFPFSVGISQLVAFIGIFSSVIILIYLRKIDRQKEKFEK